MYGEDSSGRRVSLLNCPRSPIISKSTVTSNPKVTATIHLPHLQSVVVLPSLEYSSKYKGSFLKRRSVSPELSSHPPPLTRHDSISSSSDRTTSPMTPSYTQDHLDPQNKFNAYIPSGQYGPLYPYSTAQSQPANFATPPHQNLSYDLGGGVSNGMGALNPQALHNLQPALPYPDPGLSMSALNRSVADLLPNHFAPSSHSTSSSSTGSVKKEESKPTSQSAGTQTSSASDTANASTPIKKKFPCPHATRFDCSDTFTTSGHASRHGKKHTGEKSVICPTCNKAFTRKDNMKQHERTHRNGNASGRGETSPTTSPTSPTMNQADAAFKKVGKSTGGRPQENRRVKSAGGRSEEDGEGESPGLDALATAVDMDVEMIKA
ncbi:MAG: hypothetical protein Q9184_003365 [Pyrenodesmia sp. 2 TL-2023]